MTVNMEVKKDGLRQTQDGIWKLTLTVQPHDMPVELMIAPMGTAYGLAMIPIDYDAKEAVPAQFGPALNEPDAGLLPITRERTAFDDYPYSNQAGMLCENERFQAFLLKIHEPPEGTILGKAWAADCLRLICGVQSRSELDDLSKVEERTAFEETKEDFEAWKLRDTYADNLDF